jgi:hypothetical protein
MKTIASTILALLILGAPALGADAQKPTDVKQRVCLYTHDIRNTEPSRDDKSLTFVMNNGDRWRNDLQGPCTGLKYNGFTWVLRGDDRVCDNMQTLRVNTTGGICVLGKFTQLPVQKAN